MSKIDFTQISQYLHVSPEGAEQPVLELPAAELLKKEKALPVLEQCGQIVKAIGSELPVSYVGLAVNKLVLANLVAAARFHRAIDLSLDLLTFQLEIRNGFPQMGFKMNRFIWHEVPKEPLEREAYLAEALTGFLRQQALPLIDSLADSAGVKPDLLWNQFASQSYSYRAYLFSGEVDQEILEQYDRDFAVLKNLSPEVFNRRRNPYVFRPRFVDNPWNPDKPTVIRSSCCMYYRREGGKKCYSCPLLTEDQRKAQYDEIKAAAAAK